MPGDDGTGMLELSVESTEVKSLSSRILTANAVGFVGLEAGLGKAILK